MRDVSQIKNKKYFDAFNSIINTCGEPRDQGIKTLAHMLKLKSRNAIYNWISPISNRIPSYENASNLEIFFNIPKKVFRGK